MLTKLKIFIATIAFATLPVAVSAAPLTPIATFAACDQRVMTFPAWYKGVVDDSCNIKIVDIMDFVKIPLNAIEILIQAVAYAAVGYIVWGGFKYMKSQGEPGKITEAKTAIINALIGLSIALCSVAIVEFISSRISA